MIVWESWYDKICMWTLLYAFIIMFIYNYMMDLCLFSCGFYWWMRKLHGLMVEQGSPKSCDSLEGAWEVWRVGVVRPTPFVGEGLKIKSLFLREFRQRVRMTQFWKHFTIQLIYDLNSSIYSKSGLKMKRELEGNSNVGTWEGGS